MVPILSFIDLPWPKSQQFWLYAFTVISFFLQLQKIAAHFSLLASPLFLKDHSTFLYSYCQPAFNGSPFFDPQIKYEQD